MLRRSRWEVMESETLTNQSFKQIVSFSVNMMSIWDYDCAEIEITTRELRKIRVGEQ